MRKSNFRKINIEYVNFAWLLLDDKVTLEDSNNMNFMKPSSSTYFFNSVLREQN